MCNHTQYVKRIDIILLICKTECVPEKSGALE